MMGTLATIAFLVLGWLQQPQGPATVLAARSITLTVGRGELVQFADEASRVSVSDPTIADAVVVSAHEVVLNGKAPGNTTIMIWHGTSISPFRVSVPSQVLTAFFESSSVNQTEVTDLVSV